MPENSLLGEVLIAKYSKASLLLDNLVGHVCLRISNSKVNYEEDSLSHLLYSKTDYIRNQFL